MVISERIVNISSLEKILERERILIDTLAKELEKSNADMNKIKKIVGEIKKTHQEATSFEFCLEHRRLRKKGHIFQVLFRC